LSSKHGCAKEKGSLSVNLWYLGVLLHINNFKFSSETEKNHMCLKCI